MTTNSTPKKLTDLRYQDNVIHISANQDVATEARRWFYEMFESKDEPKVNKLFEEEDTEQYNGKLLGKRTVYEAYMDSGSVDYLYIVKS